MKFGRANNLIRGKQLDYFFWVWLGMYMGGCILGLCAGYLGFTANESQCVALCLALTQTNIFAVGSCVFSWLTTILVGFLLGQLPWAYLWTMIFILGKGFVGAFSVLVVMLSYTQESFKVLIIFAILQEVLLLPILYMLSHASCKGNLFAAKTKGLRL